MVRAIRSILTFGLKISQCVHPASNPHGFCCTAVVAQPTGASGWLLLKENFLEGFKKKKKPFHVCVTMFGKERIHKSVAGGTSFKVGTSDFLCKLSHLATG